MTASILASIFFVFSFFALYAGVHTIKKSEKELNLICWLTIEFVTVLCWSAFCAGFINMVRIPINIVSVGIALCISAVMLWIRIKKTNEKQIYKFEYYDLIYCVIYFVILFYLIQRMTGKDLAIVFYNSDAAIHLKSALEVVRHQKIENMYFAELLNGLIIEIFMPFLAEINYYKVFIIVDAVALFVEAVFFMVVIRDFLKDKWMKIAGILIGLVYLFGYPFNGYLFTFLYWGMGVMLIGYLLLMLRYFENEEINRNMNVLALMLGCNAVAICYMLFGPIIFIATFICLILIQARKGKVFTKGNVFLALKVFLLPCIIAIYYCYVDYLMNQDLSAAQIMQIPGGSYQELFINFIWVAPFVIYMFIKAIRNKHFDEMQVFAISFILLTFILFVLAYKSKVSPYYYFKFYYPIWMLFFVMTVQAVSDLWKKSWEILISYALVFVVMAIMCFGNIENRIIDKGTGVQLENRSDELFDLYRYNVAVYKATGCRFSDEYLAMCNYVLEDLDGEKVPLLSTIENYTNCYWYEAITGQDCSEFYGWHYTLEQMQEKITKGEVNYIAVFRDSPIYGNNQEYFDSLDIVYSTNACQIMYVGK